MRIALFAIDVVHQLMGFWIVWRQRCMVGGKRIEHPRLGHNLQRSVGGVPARIGSLLSHQSARFSIGLSTIVASMASNDGAHLQNYDHNETLPEHCRFEDPLGH